MTNPEHSRYVGSVAFESWVLHKTLIGSDSVHPTPKSTLREAHQRIDNKPLRGRQPKILGGFVEEIKPDGSIVSAVRPDIKRLGNGWEVLT